MGRAGVACEAGSRASTEDCCGWRIQTCFFLAAESCRHAALLHQGARGGLCLHEHAKPALPALRPSGVKIRGRRLRGDLGAARKHRGRGHARPRGAALPPLSGRRRRRRPLLGAAACSGRRWRRTLARDPGLCLCISRYCSHVYYILSCAEYVGKCPPSLCILLLSASALAAEGSGGLDGPCHSRLRD